MISGWCMLVCLCLWEEEEEREEHTGREKAVLEKFRAVGGKGITLLRKEKEKCFTIQCILS